MKNLLKKMNVSVFAVLLGFGLIALQSGFTPVKEKRADAYWRLDSDDSADALNGFQYLPVTGDPDEVSCDTGDDIPCVIAVPDNVTTQQDLDDYLEENYDTVGELTGDAYSTKIEP
ncbi:hypothetical protein J7E50_05410 [Pedobacter sp. ISL-68]|uniref:hypothetical protein n=1 Tax=unclassified Pedobacter TaxID=2628915 RepID=UPI001BE6C9C8|nr:MULTISPECIES: hypothetical protein [unclassified Pedobacter]MBT2563753.1 hypothetical protein [Pedobacter sp. ISL-64]MBT2589645.1 hypothetical protein [Pedobacter sp. ISL-68]